MVCQQLKGTSIRNTLYRIDYHWDQPEIIMTIMKFEDLISNKCKAAQKMSTYKIFTFIRKKAFSMLKRKSNLSTTEM